MKIFKGRNVVPGASTIERANQKLLHTLGGKVGATSGWTVGAAANLQVATLPASQTASTLVIPITGLKPGWIITGFHLVGGISSSGGAVTLDAALRKGTAAASSTLTDALIGAGMTQLAVTAATLVSKANARKTGLSEVVSDSCNYYLLITGTTAASTSVGLGTVAIEYVEK